MGHRLVSRHTAQALLGALPRTRANTHTHLHSAGWHCWDCCLLTLAVANTSSFTSFPLTLRASSQNTPITLVSVLPPSHSLAVSHVRLLTTNHLSLCWLCPLDSKSHPPLGQLVFMGQPVPVCVGFPWVFCSQACGHISPACMFLNKQLSHCFSKGLSCLTRKSFICALIHSWLLCLL